MTDDSTPTKPTVTVTLDLTDDDVYAVLVNSLREAADEADHRAEREGESESPNEDWVDDQERMAQIGRALVANIETQIDDAARARQQENHS
ncbi:hypothetical protein DEI93_16355 (plasmid) [Curtobacterium sp. MCBD17_035]|uniref:hypothetical protein n=1 Tax=Curtobacterium sp. MCBD17_035 TaxID=2175673 RepID=UPI000DA7EF42|nr:hypothetical protein [Curtobacterium sp. MCBD17_035]WIB69144.1 hypothetical protein DEI93_16355 [Curtobacterium sp. MCBD17_035]